MTGDEMENLLKEIGWKRIDLARRLKVSKNVPTNWGKQGPPNWVAEYLRMLADLHGLYRSYLTPDRAGEAARPQQARPNPRTKERSNEDQERKYTL